MPAGLLPTIVRTVGPIVLREVIRNRRKIAKAVQTTADAAAGTVFRAFSGKKPKGKTFIMRRGRQRFECRRVN